MTPHAFDRRQFLQSVAATTVAAGITPLWARSAESSTAVVHTDAGLIRGKVHDGIACFLGVPYGGDTRLCRFQPPVHPASWKGVRDAFAFGDRAPQIGARHRPQSQPPIANENTYHLPPDEGEESEDCLHLNVWTPSPHPAGHANRPVLLYFHGGAYNGGTVNSLLYDGTRLCHRGDVVVITVNHRLNAFGFLYLAELTNDHVYADSGNVGMLDLVLALQWVQANIAAFGGDLTRVTIFGQSGGGAKCATMMAMPSAHGLFHRVMSMSGQQVTAAPRDIATARARQFVERLGLAGTAPAELRTALNAMPLAKLQDAASVSSAWLPVVDDRSLPRDPFSPDAPPLSQNVPMILGNTHDETRGLIGSSQPALFSLTWEQLPGALKKNVGTFLGPVAPEEVVAKYREWYPGYSASDVFFAAATAFRSWPGQVIEAERRAQSAAQQRTWVYQMDWRSPVADGRFGAPHTVDIPFFFDNLASSPGAVGAGPDLLAAAQPLADLMCETLIAYARTGDPNHAGLPHWPAYDLAHRSTMIWNTKTHIEDDPRGNQRRLAETAHYRQPGT